MGSSYYNKYYDDDYRQTYMSSNGTADDDFIDLSYTDFDSVSLMPVSCVN